MMRLGSTRALAGAAHHWPVAERDLEQIHAIPHTMAIQARIAAASRDPGFGDRLEARTLAIALADALDRDILAATRPADCWCYGRGGLGERAVLVPGSEVPLVLSAYCPCADGEARRVLDDGLREQGKAYAAQSRLQGIWEAARIPERFDGCTLDTFPILAPKMRGVVQSVRGWLETPGWALVLHGDYGVGKTGLGVGVLRQAAERHQVGLFVKTPDLLARVRATYGKNADASELQVLESLTTVPLLLLDDLGVGAESLNDWASTMLFQVLDTRHDNGRKTIVTTNLDIPGMAVNLGERTMHRFEEGALFLTVDGPNLRRTEAA